MGNTLAKFTTLTDVENGASSSSRSSNSSSNQQLSKQKIPPSSSSLPFQIISKIQFLFTNEPSEMIFFGSLFIGLSFISGYTINKFYGKEWYFISGRVGSKCLDLCCSLTVTLVLKKLISSLKSLRTFRTVLPLDSCLSLHILISRYLIPTFLLIHISGHAMRYYIRSLNDSKNPFLDTLFLFRNGKGWTQVTGWALVAILSAIVITSLNPVRRRTYEVFRYAHYLYIPFYAILLFHGGKQQFWYWFIGPGMLFSVEVFLRMIHLNEYGYSYVEKAKVFPPRVLRLDIRRPPLLDFKAGDYVYLRIPAISQLEWHPFTISSKVNSSKTVSVHIKVIDGGWTNKLYGYFMNDVNLERSKLEVYIDGPYRSNLTDIFDVKHAVVIAGGIGVSPFASILPELIDRSELDRSKSGPERIDFVWINKHVKSFEWFPNLFDDLGNHQELINTHLYATEVNEDTCISEDRIECGKPSWEQFFHTITKSHSNPVVFFCGPERMEAVVERQCAKYGLKLRIEQFFH